MRLKTEKTNAKDATDACKEALIRGGCETMTNSTEGLHLGGDKPGEVYDVWFYCDGHLEGEFVRIYKGTAASKTSIGFVFWDRTNKIILRLV